MTWPSEPAAICAHEAHTKDPSKALLDMDKIVKYDLEEPKYLGRQKQAVASFASGNSNTVP